MFSKQTSNAANVAEFGSSESSHVSSQAEADEMKIAVLGAQHTVDGVDQKCHLPADQTGVNCRSNVIGQIGSVFPIDANDIDVSLRKNTKG
jgi:hypothetical protein